MTLEVEDGTCKANAESLCTVAAADTYHTNRGRETTWSNLDEEVKEAKLRAATDYIQQMYADQWQGIRMTYTQALDWPRKYVPRTQDGSVINDPNADYWWPETSIPAPIANACAELAFRAVSGDLISDLGRVTIEETAGPVSVKYAPGSREQVRYEAVENILRRFLIPDEGPFVTAERY